MTNIRDIAKKAGVSVSTVSRVLNNHPYVSDQKRKRVEEIIDELNYEQNMNAVHLSKGKTQMVAIVLPFVNHPYFSMLLEGIASEALKAQYQLVICQTNYEVQKEVDALNMLKTKQVDGVIICSRASDWNVIEHYQMYGPIIICENTKERSIPSVYIDHFGAFEQALTYLNKEGHRHIGYCIGRHAGTNSQQRAAAYHNYLKKVGEPFRPEWVFEGCLYVTDGDWIVKQLLNMKKRPTALLVTNDQVAVGVMTRCAQEGISVPSDIAIIGFDNHPLTSYLQITTIQLPLIEMGEKLFYLFLHPEHQKIELPFQLIERKTV
ncbi:LacI family DNA-binding transcriptional regulator [Priestia megaterium]|nr:LacI family DNA-binding transcriptional regulator [Priestia megaterium]